MPRAHRDAAWRLARLRQARLYLCTPLRERLGGFVERVLATGVDVVQLRDKHAAREDLAAAAEDLRAVCARHDALLIVNDDPALAAEVDADGVHVGQDDGTVTDARAAVTAHRLVGRSTHGPAQLTAALRTDADYLGVGPVHATPTKEGRPGVGLGPVRDAVARADRPWFVTGGMTPHTIPEVVAAGAERVVVVRALTEADDPVAATAALRAAIAPAPPR